MSIWHVFTKYEKIKKFKNQKILFAVKSKLKN